MRKIVRFTGICCANCAAKLLYSPLHNCNTCPYDNPLGPFFQYPPDP